MIVFGATSPSRQAVAQEPAPVFDVYEAGVVDLQAAMASGAVTSVQLVDLYLARIEAFDQTGPSLNAILQLNPHAHQQAEALDEERARQGPRGPLHGIPVILKDNFDVAGLPTTAGSIALLEMVPPDDSWVVRRLREAGAVVLGKTNMHELAFGSTTVSSVGGQTRNPYDLTRNPGGSSGGTAVAVSASFAAVGWGTDTCGSVRIPAAFNGLFGLRPTKGLISMDGVVPLSHTLDTPGPMARTVMDLAITLDAVVAPDPEDPAAAMLEGAFPRFVEALREDALDGVRVGVLGDYLDGTWTIARVLADLGRTLPSGGTLGQAEVMGAMLRSSDASLAVGEAARRALEGLGALGAEIIELEIEGLDSLLVGHEVIDQEFDLDLRAYLVQTPNAPVHSVGDILASGLHDPSIEEVLIRRNSPGSQDSREYRDDLARLASARAMILQVFERERLDALAYPTMRRPPAGIGQAQWGSTCLLSSSTGFPATTMPSGLGPEGSPVGLELMGRPGDDARLLAFAYAYEQATRPRIPPGSVPRLSRVER